MEIVVKNFNELSIKELYEILKIRVNVFVVEQNCPYEELDDKDYDSYQVYIKEKDEIIAYLRVIKPGIAFESAALGRVISLKRRQGIGTILLKEGIKVAKEKYQANMITIEAQTYAIPFYEAVGFKVVSKEFLEDNIPHVRMKLRLGE